MFKTMMYNPWFYVALMGALITLTLGILLAVRLMARKEGDRSD